MRQQQQQTMTKKQQRNRSIRGFGIVLALVAVVALGISIFSGDDGDDEVATDASTTTSVAEDAPATVTVEYPGPGAKITGDTPCPPADGAAERTTSFEKAPPTCIDAAKTYTATITTSEGDIVVELDDEKAPIAVNNFVVLARYGYYENVPFHRIIPGFMDQAGTPVDQGSADIETTPGYVIPDELPDVSGLASPGDAYPDGALATANRGPDTASSQFFIVVNGGGQQFAANPAYTVFGQVIEGLEVASAINAFGDQATNGTPTKAITIEKVTITES
jgi:cyclophilin family peptidyl-prolyl cis-trans isomerase